MLLRFSNVTMSNKRRFQDLTIRDNLAAVMMQVAKQKLGKRARYYHSQMDMEALGSGHEYNELLQIYSTVFSQMIIIYI